MKYSMGEARLGLKKHGFIDNFGHQKIQTRKSIFCSKNRFFLTIYWYRDTRNGPKVDQIGKHLLLESVCASRAGHHTGNKNGGGRT